MVTSAVILPNMALETLWINKEETVQNNFI